MGYRSSVAFVIMFDDKQTAKDYYDAKISSIINEDTSTYMSDPIQLCDRFIMAHYEYLKWYEGAYNDVDSVMEFLHKSQEAEGFVGYRYVRLGEDYNDNETDEAGQACDLWDFVDISRSLYVNFPKEKNDGKNEGGMDATAHN